MPADPLRPAFHFAPARNWMNDPNGLVWHEEEYHLFFQYNPHGTGWGNMSWGHAVSPDLVHWEELPVAIGFTEAEHVFSGSVVVDRANTSGLGSTIEPAMVALYTGHDPATGAQWQSVAYSLDRGRTWDRYAGNPVLDIGSSDFRDPKVFWDNDAGRWVMLVALAEKKVVRLYGSDDLLGWEQLSEFGPAGAAGGPWECPDLFPLPVDGDPHRRRWVMVVSVQRGAVAGGSGTQYFVGDFDGHTFTAEAAPEGASARWVDFGADYYAAASFGGTPDGRRLLLGWMSNWDYAPDVPAGAFRGSMALLRSYELRTVNGEIRLVQHPVTPGPSGPTTSLGPRTVSGVDPLPADCHGAHLRVVAELEPGTADRFGILVRLGGRERTVVGYDVPGACAYVDRTRSGVTAFHPAFPAVHRAPLSPEGGIVRLEAYVDSASVEVFAGRGEVVLTDQIFPDADSTGLALFAEGGTAHLRVMEVTQLDPNEG